MTIETAINDYRHRYHWLSTPLSMTIDTVINDYRHRYQWLSTPLSMTIDTVITDYRHRHQCLSTPLSLTIDTVINDYRHRYQWLSIHLITCVLWHKHSSDFLNIYSTCMRHVLFFVTDTFARVKRHVLMKQTSASITCDAVNRAYHRPASGVSRLVCVHVTKTRVVTRVIKQAVIKVPQGTEALMRCFFHKLPTL